MGKVYDAIEGRIADFIAAQHVFFVATAPRSDRGLLNLSPKGLESFQILGPCEVAYLDMPGSGIETVAHLRENGRIVLMFCAFDGPPNIVRLYGRGEALEPGDPGFDALRERFPEGLQARTIVRVAVAGLSDVFQNVTLRNKAWVETGSAFAFRFTTNGLPLPPLNVPIVVPP